MAGGMVFAVGDFSAHVDIPQNKVILQDPFNIVIDLSDGIDINLAVHF